MRDAPEVVICGRVDECPDAPAECQRGRRCAECGAEVVTTDTAEHIINRLSARIVCDYCVEWQRDDTDLLKHLRTLATAAQSDALPPRGSLVEVTCRGCTRAAIVAVCFSVDNLPDLRLTAPDAPPATLITQYLREMGASHAGLLLVRLGPALVPYTVHKLSDGWHDADGDTLTITPVPKHRQQPQDN